MLSYQNGCCLQAIAVILADIMLFLSDWLCSSQYFVVEFTLQEEFLPEGSWKTVRQDVNRGASPPAVSAALLGGCVCVCACNKKYCTCWSQAVSAAETSGFPVMFKECDSCPQTAAHHVLLWAQPSFWAVGVAVALQLRGASASCWALPG